LVGRIVIGNWPADRVPGSCRDRRSLRRGSMRGGRCPDSGGNIRAEPRAGARTGAGH